MKLLVLTDIHGHRSIVEKIVDAVRQTPFDALILCGDLTDFGGVKQAENIIDEFTSLRKPILFISGNCDAPELAEKEKVNNAVNIHGKCMKLGDSTFIGVGGSSPTPFGTLFELSEADIKRTAYTAYDCMKQKTPFILVSHTPPANTSVDITVFGVHAGSKAIRDFIEKTKPAIVICGHIHEAQGTDHIGETLIVNPGPAYRGFYAFAEVDDRATVEMNAVR